MKKKEAVLLDNVNVMLVPLVNQYAYAGYLDSYTNDTKPHYRMYIVANNPQRCYFDARIVGSKDWESKRKKLK